MADSPNAAGEMPANPTRTEVALKVRRMGHDLRNLLTILYGISDGYDDAARSGAARPDSVGLLAEVTARIELTADNLRQLGHTLLESDTADLAEIATHLMATFPDLGRFAAAFAGRAPVRGHESELRLLLMSLGSAAQSCGGLDAVTVNTPEGAAGNGGASVIRVTFVSALPQGSVLDLVRWAANGLRASLRVDAPNQALEITLGGPPHQTDAPIA